MYRFYSILAALLIAANTLAMPVHLAVGHGHELAHQDGFGNLLSTLDTDCENAEWNTKKGFEVFDASCCGTPHNHDGHHHDISAQGYIAPRAGSTVLVAWVQSPLRELLATTKVPQPVGTNDPATYHAPCLTQPTLRGPPRV